MSPLGSRLKDFDEENQRKRKRSRSSREWLNIVDVVDFLEAMECLNISQATSTEVSFSCPFPGHTHGDDRPSAYMNDGSQDKSKATVWTCFGCGRSGNAISFYAEMENVSKQEAARHLREQYAPGFRQPKDGLISVEFEQRLASRKNHDKKSFQVISFVDYERLFAVDWQDAEQQYESLNCPPEVAYLFDRGFNADTLEVWDIGYDHFSQRITIPINNEYHQLVGVKGRTWKPKSQERVKYRVLGDKPGRRKRYGFMPYEKSLVVFGLHRAYREEHCLVLVEGELDVIALWQVGVPAVSSGSAALSQTQAKLIRDHADEVIIFFDSDTAGRNAVFGWEGKDGIWHPGILEKLNDFMRVKVVPEHEDDAAKLVELGKTDKLYELLDNAISGSRLLLE